MADIIEFKQRLQPKDKRPQAYAKEPKTLDVVESLWGYEGKAWQCNCGNMHFLVGPDGVFCPTCGVWADFP